LFWREVKNIFGHLKKIVEILKKTMYRILESGSKIQFANNILYWAYSWRYWHWLVWVTRQCQYLSTPNLSKIVNSIEKNLPSRAIACFSGLLLSMRHLPTETLAVLAKQCDS
jgi:hypothetical protein